MLRVVTLVFLCLFTSSAFAQETLYLIRVVQADSEEPAHVWWQGSSASFSEDDITLMEAARSQNLNVIRPVDLSQISRILRQPVLSEANAANLARLLGAEVAVLGSIEISGQTQLSVLPLHGYRGKLRAKILRLNGSEVATEDVEIIQHGYDREAEESRKSVLAHLGRRIALSLKQTKRTPTGPVGIQTNFPVLRFDGLESGRALDLISNFLLELNQVQNVEVVWVGRGQIALKVVNKSRESLERSEVEQIGRSLVNAQFDGFRVSMSAGESSLNALEFTLVPSNLQP